MKQTMVDALNIARKKGDKEYFQYEKIESQIKNLTQKRTKLLQNIYAKYGEHDETVKPN